MMSLTYCRLYRDVDLFSILACLVAAVMHDIFQAPSWCNALLANGETHKSFAYMGDS